MNADDYKLLLFCRGHQLFEEAIHGEPHRLCKYGKISLKIKIFFDKKCLIPSRWYQNHFLLKFGNMPIATR